ncbi:hypothetical protein LPJ81_002886, partial [Coemansia sp. IMI 209127]
MTIAAPVTQPDSGDTARESPGTARESPDTARESPDTARGPPDTAEETHHRLKDVRWMDAQTNTERVVRIATQNENGP